MRMISAVLDSADPARLADFYRVALGWEQTHSDDVYVFLGSPDATRLGFQKIEDYQAPKWPDEPTHAHVDFAVPDVEEAVERLLALGATRPANQPGGDEWVVLLDPEGHPFCISRE